MEHVAFIILSVMAVGAALGMILARKLVHSILWFAGVLLGVAGLLALLRIPFLAIGQLVVFVGGMIPLLLFGIMFTVEESMPKKVRSKGAVASLGSWWPQAALGAILFGILAASVYGGIQAREVGGSADFMQFSMALFIRYRDAILLGAFGLAIAMITAVFFLEEDEREGINS